MATTANITPYKHKTKEERNGQDPSSQGSRKAKSSAFDMSDLLDQVDQLLDADRQPSVAYCANRRHFGSKLLELKRLQAETIQAVQPVVPEDDFEALLTLTEIPKAKAHVPPLTAEEDALVDDLLHTPRRGPISQFKTAVVEHKDIQKLQPETWLNDEIINFYMLLLMERANTLPDAPSIHCFNTFFCSTLRDQGYDKVRRWTKRVDIFSKDLVLIPINRSYHWTLGAVDMVNKRVSVYDSLNGSHDHAIKLIMDYLDKEHMDKKKTPFDRSGWTGGTTRGIPQQGNMSDCGVFACTFAERLARKAPFDFTQADMVPIRRRMILDIKQKQLSI